MNFTVELLARHHDRSGFASGSQVLDDYITKLASQDMRRRVAQVFVALPQNSYRVAGFYTLSAGSVEHASLPPELVRRLPRYPVPVARIGRLAVDLSWAGQGLGTLLLVDAFRRVLRAGNALAIYAVIVDAKDERAQRFYERFGFIPLPKTRRCLFYPLSDAIRKLALGTS